MTDPRSIPPHLREDVFRAYEGLIDRAVSRWPEETSFTIPSGVAPSTFVANFRNAILSLKNFSWETSIDTAKLWSIRVEYVINRDVAGLVWFRRRQPRGRPNLATSLAPTEASISGSGLVSWRDATEEEIRALCVLLNSGRLVGPFTIDGEVDAGLMVELPTLYNVAMVYDPATKKTMIT